MHSYGFSSAALRLVRSYLSNKKQKTKTNESFSSWEEILFGVPQGSILGPLLFNIFICDHFIMIHDINIANYADDNSPFVSGDTPLNVITSSENAAEKLFEWFANNHMKANHDKCHLLMSTLTPISITVKDYVIENSDNEKLLGVTVDANLNFNCHLENILKKARELHLIWVSLKESCWRILFLLHNLIIAHLLGCAIAVQWITRLIVCVKGASALYTVTLHRLE